MEVIHIALIVSGNAEIKNASSHHVEKLCHFFNKKNTSFAPLNVHKKLLDNKNMLPVPQNYLPTQMPKLVGRNCSICQKPLE